MNTRCKYCSLQMKCSASARALCREVLRFAVTERLHGGEPFGDPQIGGAVDIWGAGVVLYQLRFGKTPFDDYLFPAEVQAAHLGSRGGDEEKGEDGDEKSLAMKNIAGQAGERPPD